MFPFIHFIVPISTYFLVISIACTLATIWFVKRAEKRSLHRVTAIDLTIAVLLGGILGARLLHVFYEDPAFYRENPLAVLQVWNGGFVFLGGVVGAWFAGMIFCQIKNEPFWFWADIAVIPISFGYALGRIACFLNGCCYGKWCDLPWAVYMQGGFRHPTQLYASFIEFIILFFLIKIEPKVRLSGSLFGSWLVLHSISRLIMEQFRDDPRGPTMAGLSLGTWMSFALLSGGLFLLAQALRLQSKDIK
jgi:phosphatidylglycerol---prolipoprotein diacylglyceryl transferase